MINLKFQNIQNLQALWCNECCQKHEINRQNLINGKAQTRIITLLQSQKSNGNVVRATAKALRGFLLEDDIREDFSKSHDHARELVEEHDAIKICLDVSKGL